jgi:hypothetical protein
MSEGTAVSTASSEASLTPSEKLETFKFYEEASGKTKAHAWTQTAWILTLNAGVIAFSLNLYLEHANDPAFLVIEYVSAGVGIVLCVFLIYVLNELGTHISNYWASSNRIAADLPLLVSYIGKDNARQVKGAKDQPEFPKFCRRLQYLAVLFMLGHIGWALLVTFIYLLNTAC